MAKRTLRTWFSVAFCAGVDEKERKGVAGLRKADCATGRAVGATALRSDGIKRCLSIGIAMIVGGETALVGCAGYHSSRPTGAQLYWSFP